MELVMIKSPHGALIPMDEGESEKMRRWKSGVVVRGDFAEMRNGAFFKKWWALVKLAYDMWEDTMPEVLHKGVPVKPEFERFRRDLVVMAGYYRPVFSATGEMRLEPESISWAKMDEAKFDRLYQATVTVILERVLNGRGMTEDELRDAVDNVMRFA